MILSQYFNKFFHSNKSSGILLILCVITSLLIANSSLGVGFQNILDTQLGFENLHLKYSVSLWINDGLMAIFFLLVGLEIKRELVEGELSDIRNASLPIVAALGGMVVPASIFAILNMGTPFSNGWAIPMATDIAFSLAIVSILGKKVPASLKIFLAALAIVDDLGAIVIIAIFYTDQIEWTYLGISAFIMVFLLILNKLQVKNLAFYLIPGFFLWVCMHHSGIHATIAGVLLAFTIPTNESTTDISPLETLEQKLHIPVSFFIMPLFALANTNIAFKLGISEIFASTLGIGIILGLFAGKVLGISLFSFAAIKMRWSQLPENSTWTQMIGVGFLAGIGFTMSIFIALLSFKNSAEIQDEAKLAILIASVLSGIVGFLLLKFFKSKKTEDLN